MLASKPLLAGLLPALVLPLASAGLVAAPGRLQVRVDPRIELLGVVFRLAGHPEYNRAAESEYVRSVDERFGALRSHSVIHLARDLRQKAGISYDAPQSLAVYLLPDRSLELLVPLEPWPAGLDGRWLKANLKAFLTELRAFARDSEFFEFFESQRGFFNRLEEVYQKAAESEDVVAWFDTFFGERPGASFTLIPAPLSGPNNYGSRVVLEGGREALYQVLGVASFEAGVPHLGSGFIPLLVHEMAHSYCNPLVDARLGDLEDAGDRLFRATKEAMRKQAYGSGRIVLCESLVRACVVLYTLERRGEEAAVRALAEEESRSFLWTGGLVEAIRRSRKEAPPSKRFVDFMPEVTKAFEAAASAEWNGRSPSFRGPLNAVFSRPDLLLVGPDRSSKALDGYLDQVYEQIFRKKGASRARAKEASGKKAAASTLVLYGTPATHPLLEAIARDAGWAFEKDRLRLGGRLFEGDGLLLLACWPSPFGPDRAVAVYAAAELDTIVGANGVFHGPTDWVVARREASGRFTTLASGDFPKGLANRWRAPGAAQ